MTVMNVPALPTEMSGDDIRNPHICLTPSESEWVQLIHSLPDNLAKQLACLIEADKDRLVGVFYDRLLQNPDACVDGLRLARCFLIFLTSWSSAGMCPAY